LYGAIHERKSAKGMKYLYFRARKLINSLEPPKRNT
jgi:hypothetical protein